MARFNKKTTQKIEMLAGGEGFKMVPEMELYASVCASVLTPQYYTPHTNDQINKLKTLIRKVDPFFVAQLAVYAREQMYLRTIPLVLTVELAKCHSGDDLLRRLSRRVIQRADEITEILAYYSKANKIQPKFIKAKGGHNVEKKIYKLSNQLRKGIADSFYKFDEYQFAKYNRNTEIKLRDALFLTHPKPRTREEQELFEKIAQNNLSIPYTWETKLSEAGQTGKDKKAVWQELILSGRMNYMALLRNMRNFLDADISEVLIQKVADRIADPKEIKRSRQLPFRFLSTYRSINGKVLRKWFSDEDKAQLQTKHNSQFVHIFLDALEKAVKLSIENIPMLMNQDLLTAIDVSGSMQRPISERSTIENYDIGALLGMLIQSKSSNSVLGMFGNTWKVIKTEKTFNVLRATDDLHKREGEVGYSTNGYKVIEWALKQKKKFSRVLIFTDCQLYGGSINNLWRQYKSQINPHAKLYLFNLNSYGETPLNLKSNDVHLITGWSDKIFDILESIENGGETLERIKEIEL
jgi:hypothetical protein